MRTFTVYQKSPPTEYTAEGRANPPDQPQFQGVVFDDGSVAVCWLTAFPSISVWGSLEALKRVHGHPEYGTAWVWADADDDQRALRLTDSGTVPAGATAEEAALADRLTALTEELGLYDNPGAGCER